MLNGHTHLLSVENIYCMKYILCIRDVRYSRGDSEGGGVEFNFKILNAASVKPETLVSQDNRNGVSVNRGDWIFHIT